MDASTIEMWARRYQTEVPRDTKPILLTIDGVTVGSFADENPIASVRRTVDAVRRMADGNLVEIVRRMA